MNWTALYTGTTHERPASYWAAECASLQLAEALAAWLSGESPDDEQTRLGALDVLAAAIADADRALVSAFEADCRAKGQVS